MKIAINRLKYNYHIYLILLITLFLINFNYCDIRDQDFSCGEGWTTFTAYVENTSEDILNNFQDQKLIVLDDFTILGFDENGNNINFYKYSSTITFLAENPLKELTISVSNYRYQSFKIGLPVLFDRECEKYNSISYYFFLEKAY